MTAVAAVPPPPLPGDVVDSTATALETPGPDGPQVEVPDANEAPAPEPKVKLPPQVIARSVPRMGAGGSKAGAPPPGTGPSDRTVQATRKPFGTGEAAKARYAAAEQDYRVYADPDSDTTHASRRNQLRKEKAIEERARKRKAEEEKWAHMPEAGAPELRDCKGGKDLVTITIDREAARMSGKLGALRRYGLKMLEKRDTSFVERPEFTPYKEEIKRFWKAHCNQLARNVGRGRCGVGPSMLVSHAAWQFGMARYYLEKAMSIDDGRELITMANKLAQGGRQNMIAAHTLCAREGQARIMGKEDTPPWLVPEPPKLDPDTGEEVQEQQPAGEPQEFDFPSE